MMKGEAKSGNPKQNKTKPQNNSYNKDESQKHNV